MTKDETNFLFLLIIHSNSSNYYTIVGKNNIINTMENSKFDNVGICRKIKQKQSGHISEFKLISSLIFFLHESQNDFHTYVY